MPDDMPMEKLKPCQYILTRIMSYSAVSFFLYMPVSFSLFETMLAFYCRLAVPSLTGGGEVSGKLCLLAGGGVCRRARQ